MGSIVRFVRYIAPYKWLLFSAFLFSGICTLLGLLMPYLIKVAVDTGLARKDIKSFIIFGTCAGIIFLAGELLDVFRRYMTQHLRNKVAFDIRRDALGHLYGLGILYFKERTAGEHLYKYDYDIDAVVEIITSSLPQILSIVPRGLVIFIVICMLDVKLAIFCAAFTVLTLILPYRMNAGMQKMWEEAVVRSEDAFKYLDETLSRMLLVKTFGKEDAALSGYLRRFGISISMRMRSLWLELGRAFTGLVLAKVLVGIVVLFGGYQVLRGGFSLGSLAAVMAYLYQLGAIQQELFGYFHTVSVGAVSCRRIAEIFDTVATVTDIPGAADAGFVKGEIVFEKVSFGYRAGQEILKNVSVRFEGGKHIALVGPSGCGKTTLTSLVVRLFDPREGRITIDGRDIQTVTLHSLKAQIGFALQEPYLWNDTVKKNIAYGVETAGEDEIMSAAKAACVYEFAACLERGYETVIGENACKLSEGQKQRIAIARALVKRPRILILDEALSSIDASCEERILHNIRNHYPAMTLLIISHRLSTVMAADKIISFGETARPIEGKAYELIKTS